MKKDKKLLICICILNAIGVVCLIYFAILYLSHSTCVSNPNAMLSVENWDRAGMMITIGMLPMLFANILGFLLAKKVTSIFKSLLFFIPSVFQLILMLHYWAL